jgi:hypothetical protein
MIEVATVDDQRRITLPAEFHTGSAVFIESLDADTLIVRSGQPNRKDQTIVSLPIVRQLPDDPEWDKVEEAFGRASAGRVPPPEED